jgi:hypothetical protein
MMELFTLSVFEKRVLRRIFGHMIDWRKLHNEELHNLYISTYIVRVVKEDELEHIACIGDMRNVYKKFSQKS